MSRFLIQMGDNRWELASIMKIGESFGGEDKMLYCWKRPTPLKTFLFVWAQFPGLDGH